MNNNKNDIGSVRCGASGTLQANTTLTEYLHRVYIQNNVQWCLLPPERTGTYY